MLYRSEPINWGSTMRVVGCNIQYNDQTLFLRHAFQKKFAGFLGLPAGKIETDEDPRQAIAREIIEETGIDTQQKLHDLTYHGMRWVRFKNGLDFLYQHFSIELETRPQIVLNKCEHSEHIWIPKHLFREYSQQFIEDVFETLTIDWKQ